MKKVYDRKVIEMDLSEIESRVVAYLSQGMRPADFHKVRAAAEFGVSTDQVTPEMREVGKRLNFFEIYGKNI